MSEIKDKIVKLEPTGFYAIKMSDFVKSGMPTGYYAIGQVLMLTSWSGFDWARYLPKTEEGYAYYETENAFTDDATKSAMSLLKRNGFDKDHVVVFKSKTQKN